MNIKQRVFFPWAIVIAAGALIVAIAALGVNVYNSRYNTTGTQSGVTMTMDFSSGRTVNAMDMNPSAGSLYTGSKQSSGSLGTKYTARYKLTTSSSYTDAWYITFNNNTSYVGPLYLTYANGSQKFNFQMVKANNVSTGSKVECDLFLK